MKKAALALVVAGFAAASAFAGNGGSCGDKKEGKKGDTKQELKLSF